MPRYMFLFFLLLAACHGISDKKIEASNKNIAKKAEKKGIVSINIFVDSTSKEYGTLSCRCSRKHSSLPDTIRYPMRRRDNLYIDIRNNTSKDIMILTRNGCYLGLSSGMKYYSPKEKAWILSIADWGGGDNQIIPSNSVMRLLISDYDTDSFRYSFNMQVDTLNSCTYFNVAFSSYKLPHSYSFHSDLKIEKGFY
jgi:hypothetical protein